MAPLYQSMKIDRAGCYRGGGRPRHPQ